MCFNAKINKYSQIVKIFNFDIFIIIIIRNMKY